MTYTYKQLSHKHPDYQQKQWEQLDDLYCGGFQIQKSAHKYLPQNLGERDEKYQERLSCASYINYLGQIVDQFIANVFSQELTVTPGADAEINESPGTVPEKPEFYVEFERDADLCGTSFEKIFRKIFTTTILKKRALLAIDFPFLEKEEGDESREAEEGVDDYAPYPMNRADEEKLGTDRAYCFELPIEYLLDWKLTGPCQFEWAVLCKVIHDRRGPGDDEELCVEQFKIWTMKDGVAHWEIWETEPYKKDRPPKPEDKLKKMGSDSTSFKAIPLMMLEVPEGLWVGNKIGTMALEHFRRRSSLFAAENRSLFSIPVVYLGSEFGSPGDAVSEVQTDPNRLNEGPLAEFKKKGYGILGKDDDVRFAEPSGHVYEIVDKQLEHLVNEMFRVTHQMAHSVASSQATYRSGKSKVEDRHAMEIVLSAYGSIARAFVKRVFDFISEARKDDIVWSPHGMDTYELEDRDLLIKEAAFATTFEIPSKTFRIAHKTKVAFALVGNVPSETKQQIRNEIAEGVDDEMEHEDLEQKLEQRVLEDNLDAPDGAHGPLGAGMMLPADSKTHHPHKATKARPGMKHAPIATPGKRSLKPQPTGRMSSPNPFAGRPPTKS